MRVLFFGTPEFAIPSLQQLHADGFNIIGVVTQPDKPVGRKQELTPSPVKIAALELCLPVFEPPTLKSDEAQQMLSALQPDLIVVVAYGKIIPPWLLALPKHGCINVHPSLLPKYRGASPIPAPILHGDTETGVTIMRMDEELDHGPILSQEIIQLDGTETGESLSKTLAALGAQQLSHTLNGYIAGTIKARDQNHDEATYTEILSREHGKIDWSQPAIDIERMIRAYYPWPGTWCLVNGGTRLKILSARLYDGENKDVDGTLWRTDSGELAVACKSGALILLTVHPEGGKPMSGADFARGYFQ